MNDYAGGNHMKIYAQKNGNLNEIDLINLASLLFKAGYTVSQKREQMGKKSVRVVEFETVEKEREV